MTTSPDSSSDQQPTPREPLSRRAVSLRLLPGTRVAGYLVGEPLGEGGMGQVYAAVDERLHRNVALKVLADDDAEGRARFLREARALARIEHHNVVRVYASGEDREMAWMALEVIAGDALSSLADNRPLDEETAVGLCAQIARGLQAVHAVGIVHRDIKPSNVLVDHDATVKLIDFGVASLDDGQTGGFRTRAGIVVGTPHFMSPEQARGAVVDARSDAWGLGATLYALLAGVPPFFGGADEADLDILARVVRDDVADIRTLAPSTSAATANLVASLLQRDANARPVDLGVVADALEAIGTALAAGTPPSSSSPLRTVSSSSSSSSPSSSSSSSSSLWTSSPSLPRAAIAPSPEVSVSTAREGGSVSVGAVVVAMVVVAGAAVGGIVGGRYVFAPAPTVVERVVEVQLPPVSPPPPPPPLVVAPPEPVVVPATADSIAAKVIATIEGRDAAVAALIARDDEPGLQALQLLVVGPEVAGDDVVEALRTASRDDTEALLETVLTAPTAPRRRQLRAIEILLERRNDRALSLLMRVADSHKDPTVRARAGAARDRIFKVE